jgi:hypothetical protein
MNYVNRYTGRAYKDDPAIVAIELINEPHYPPDTTDAQVTEYINALTAAVRSTGSRKPVFYNCWINRSGAAADSTLDGVTFGWYPTGLVNGAMLRSNYLPRVADYPSMRDPRLAAKAKIVYEFDSADVHASYMYPAMARAFRSGGAQIATQFQYEPMCIADGNPNWQTHYLNLIYTPNKAVSFAIAVEVFRRVPRLTKADTQKPGFFKKPGFSFAVSFEEDLSELSSEDTLMYSNNTKTSPPAPGKLTRIAGCGSSPVVRYEGTGAYFLDRLSPGVWKLQVYPDAVMVADPYTGGDNEKVRALWGTWPMEIRLPDLGEGFQVAPCDRERRAGKPVAAQGRAIQVAPGEYLLAADGKEMPEKAPGVEWIAPPSSKADPAVFVDAPATWRERKPLTVSASVAVPGRPQCTLNLRPAGATAFQAIPMTATKPYQYTAQVPAGLVLPGKMSYYLSALAHDRTYTFPPGAERKDEEGVIAPVDILGFAPNDAPPSVRYGGPEGKSAQAKFVPGRDSGTTAMRIEADGFGPPPSCAGVEWKPRNLASSQARFDSVNVLARGGPDTNAVEVTLVQRDGNAYGTDVPLWPTWGETTIPISRLKPMWKTKGGALDLSQLDHVSIVFGAWLFADRCGRRHAVEIQRVELAQKPNLWTLSVAAKNDPVALIEPALRRVRTHGHEAAATVVRGMDPGKRALRVSVSGFDAPPSSTSFRLSVSPEVACCRDEMKKAKSVIIKARAGQPGTTRLEMVLIEADGTPWGTTVPLREEWQAVKIALSGLKYFSHWKSGPQGRGGWLDHVHPAKIQSVNICFGAWLCGKDHAKPQAFEIQDVVLSLEGN